MQSVFYVPLQDILAITGDILNLSRKKRSATQLLPYQTTVLGHITRKQSNLTGWGSFEAQDKVFGGVFWC